MKSILDKIAQSGSFPDKAKVFYFHETAKGVIVHVDISFKNDTHKTQTFYSENTANAFLSTLVLQYGTKIIRQDISCKQS